MLTEEGQRTRISGTPTVILVVGVNGVGKTTTIGKLANYFHLLNYKVMIAAADTFRAAASEQLAATLSSMQKVQTRLQLFLTP